MALEAIYEPSGLNSRPVTVSVCPLILYKIALFRKSHIYKNEKEKKKAKYYNSSIH